jgi:ferredoxin
VGRIRKVWIEEGCISCSLCQDICAEVFRVDDGEDCVVREDAPRHFEGKDEEIREAAQDCPVEVIRFAEEAKVETPTHQDG